jgi:hypothetical protein
MIKRCAMTFENYTEKITELIRKDHLKAALDLLAALLALCWMRLLSSLRSTMMS